MVKRKRRTAQTVSDKTTITTDIRRSAISLAVAAALPGAMAMPSVAIAQDDAGEPDVVEEVVTYGKFRRSLVDQIATKRDSTKIVEALSAEDIGKLPDSSIAESLSRLPGLAGERRNGRTTGISVRGFREDYTAVTMNGRELLGIGDNRGVEYDLYPSEMISGVVVYKTPDAGLIHQGIGGIVDLRTTRPLDEAPYLVFNGNYEMNQNSSANPDFDDTGYRLALSFSDVFADDTLGLAVTLATTESPSQEEQFRGWNYNTVSAPGFPVTDPSGNVCDFSMTDPGCSLSGNERGLEGHDSFVRSATLERHTAAAVLQWEATEDVTVTLDGLYIDFTEDKAFRGVEEAHYWGPPSIGVTSLDGDFVSSGFMDGFHSVVRNDLETQEAELQTFGLNVEWDVTQDWALKFDAAHSTADKSITNIESYSGVGRSGLTSQGPQTFRSWASGATGATYSDHPTTSSPDLTDWNIMQLAGPQPWGGGMGPLADTICPTTAACTASDGSVVNHNNAQDGFVNEPIFDEELTTIRLSASRPVDWGLFTNVEFGVYYSDRSKSKLNNGFYLTAPSFPDQAPIPEEFRMGIVPLDFLGIDGIVAYDSLGLYQSGFYTAWDASELQADRLGDTYEIKEELTTLFAMFDIDTELGDVPIRGNIGLQFVNADQEGSGFGATNGPNLFIEGTPILDGDDYSDVLPSMNLTFELNENHLVRVAASKTLSRPRMDQMKPNNQVSFNFNYGNVISTSPASGPWSGNAGNARLKPLESNQLDLSYEWYFSDDGFVAAAWFYKDLTNWHRDAQFIVDFTDFYIPGFHQAPNPNDPTDIATPGTFLGLVSAKEDGLKGYVRGIELQGNLNFGQFTPALDGLGLISSAAFYDGSLDDGTAVPGLSEETYQSTLYYEYGGFQARLSWTKRDQFATEFRGLSLALTPTVDQGAELLDAQIGYDFGLGGFDRLDGLFISLQGQNLTGEDTVQSNVDPREILLYQSFGANYILNINYKFQ